MCFCRKGCDEGGEAKAGRLVINKNIKLRGKETFNISRAIIKISNTVFAPVFGEPLAHFYPDSVFVLI
jgi:hypothetical protein